MENKELKKKFGEFAEINGFDAKFGGWFIESTECILVLDLQKSSYGNYFELNIKIYVQGMFGEKYIQSKNLVKKDIGDVFIRQPEKYDDMLNLENQLKDSDRIEKLQSFFSEFMVPFSQKALTKKGLKVLAKGDQVSLLPAVEKELG